ncbi:MAG: amidohydrolase family protein [Chloroflexi bacterium]|nr:amidohydrolase family protein [Chloroflexota bacterium]
MTRASWSRSTIRAWTRSGRRPANSNCRSPSTSPTRSPSSTRWTTPTSAGRSCTTTSTGSFPSPPFPTFLTVVNGLATVVERHRGTTVVGAHVGCYAENLEWVGALLDRCRNFYVAISERIAELGRQPYSARRFFLKYADRILFGTDRAPDEFIYPVYYRFLETDDEYFPYGIEDVPRQGRWRICGLYLPDEVLRKVYYDNARRVILGDK